MEQLIKQWQARLPKAEIIPLSAKAKFNTDTVLQRIEALLPEGPAYFEKDQWTDKSARFFVTEIIREKILLYYAKEIPYSVEVVVELFKEDAKKIHINAVIYVEGYHHRAQRYSFEESVNGSSKGLGALLQQEHLFGSLCKSQQRLAQQRTRVGRIWI